MVRRADMLFLALMLISAIFASATWAASSEYRVAIPYVRGDVVRSGGETRTGEATYYTFADGRGNCSFDATPDDLMVGAMNKADYTGAALCGAFVEITGPKGTVTVRVVDQCPECPKGNIDLSPQAFDRIAERVQGRVPITWHTVSPEISGPIRYRIKEGSSQWWTAVQIRNHRNPIAKLEVRDDKGQFVAMVRQDYNYFIRASPNEGLGPGPYTFRVTDIYGNMLTDSNIPLQIATEISGAGQFPRLP